MTIPTNNLAVSNVVIIGIPIYVMGFPCPLFRSAPILPYQLLCALIIMPMCCLSAFAYSTDYCPKSFNSAIGKGHFVLRPGWSHMNYTPKELIVKINGVVEYGYGGTLPYQKHLHASFFCVDSHKADRTVSRSCYPRFGGSFIVSISFSSSLLKWNSPKETGENHPIKSARRNGCLERIFSIRPGHSSGIWSRFRVSQL